MNKCILIGRLTKDVDLRKTTSGTSVANFTLAVNKDYKNEEGKYDADFISCVAFKGLAETIRKYVHKGDRFGVVGKISTRKYENNDGKTVYVTEVKVDDIEFLEPKKDTDVPQGFEPSYEGTPFDDVTDAEGLPF